MKKIIAMLLCVALVASLGISAFADGLLTTHDYAYYWNKLVDDSVAKGPIEQQAKALNAAKKAYGDAKDDLSKAVANLSKAVQTVQYNMVANYYSAATQALNVQFQNAINEAWANYNFEMYKTLYDVTPGWKY